MEPPAAAPTAAARRKLTKNRSTTTKFCASTRTRSAATQTSRTRRRARGGARAAGEAGGPRLLRARRVLRAAAARRRARALRPGLLRHALHLYTCVVLEDVTHGMRAPCIVDIKIGTSTVAPDAGWEKRLSHLRKDRATTRPLGLRLIGAQTVGAAGDAPLSGAAPWGKALRPEEVGPRCAAASPSAACCARRRSRTLSTGCSGCCGLETAPSRQLLGSSILCVYDGAEDDAASPPPALRVIDFAHAYPLRATRDHGYCYGLRHLIRLLRGLLPPDAEIGEVGGGGDDDGEAEEVELSPRTGPLEEDGRAALHADEFAEGAAHCTRALAARVGGLRRDRGRRPRPQAPEAASGRRRLPCAAAPLAACAARGRPARTSRRAPRRLRSLSRGSSRAAAGGGGASRAGR